jgi:hypothetical protein
MTERMHGTLADAKKKLEEAGEQADGDENRHLHVPGPSSQLMFYAPFGGVFGDRQAIEAACTDDPAQQLLQQDATKRAKAKRLRLLVFLELLLLVIWALIAYLMQ